MRETCECTKTMACTVTAPAFHRPELSDKPWVDALLSHSNYMGCEHAFGTAYIWTHAYHTHLARYEDFLLVCGKRSFSFPAGRGDVKEALHVLRDFSEACKRPFLIHGVTEEMMSILEDTFPDYFDYKPMRDSFDYIYLTEKLIHLSGKKYHGKRSHISKFSREHTWQYEDITKDNVSECLEVGRIWCKAKNAEDSMQENDAEYCALSRAMRRYFELGFKGGLIRVEGRVVAFTCGEHLNKDTFVIHFEKALPDFEGAYPVINNQFATHQLAGYRYVNREEDLGIEGLRKAKLSYRPEILLEKYLAVPKDVGMVV